MFFAIVAAIAIGQWLWSSRDDDAASSSPPPSPVHAQANDAGNVVQAAIADSSEGLPFLPPTRTSPARCRW